ncbi:MAG TPA: hypothetical protein VK982_05690 [Bacteroidales bacterium]|nr:hypothetical protein [Bacteroidales bacterium]
MNLKEHKEKVEGMIGELEKMIELIDEKRTLYYQKGWEFIRSNVLPNSYGIEKGELSMLKKELTLVNLLIEKYGENKEDDIIYNNEDYGVEIRLSLHPYKTISMGIYLESKGNWLYNNYISSHSGLNEWSREQVNQKVSLYIGHSEYSHAFGTYTVETVLRMIADLKEEPKVRFDLINKVINVLVNNRKISKQLKAEFDLMFKFMFENKGL